jgi:hypothetical protein
VDEVEHGRRVAGSRGRVSSEQECIELCRGALQPGARLGRQPVVERETQTGIGDPPVMILSPADDGRESRGGATREQFVEQPRLAGPGIAPDEHDPARAGACPLELTVEQRQLSVATDRLRRVERPPDSRFRRIAPLVCEFGVDDPGVT